MTAKPLDPLFLLLSNIESTARDGLSSVSEGSALTVRQAIVMELLVEAFGKPGDASGQEVDLALDRYVTSGLFMQRLMRAVPAAELQAVGRSCRMVVS